MIVAKLQEQIGELSKQIREIQEECNHPKSVLTVEHKGSTGNYDPQDDCYWTTNHCGLCDKSWTEREK